MEVELLAVTPDPEKVIEQAGRTCYMSHQHTTEGSAARFIRMLVSKGHLSVLEHASATFRISGVSRVSTHQIVRHRLCSFSQKSQRYVRESDDGFVTPPSIEKNRDALAVFNRSVSSAKRAYEKLLALGMSKEDARFVLPNATGSEIVLSANFRELRHIIQTRGAREAQWEVREIAIRMLRLLKKRAPNVFFDLIEGSNNCVEQQVSKHR